MRLTTLLFLSFLSLGLTRPSEFIQLEPRNYNWNSTLAEDSTLPEQWYWGDVNGTNYLTKNLNQHIPQYCGSCWAHGALSSLADRIKMARNASKPDINLPVQYLLNCGDAGTCRGGDPLGAYRFIKEKGIPFDTCLAYEACSFDSVQQVCKNRNFSCIPENVCRTCSSKGCQGIDPYPNVTIESYGSVRGWENMMEEIYLHGPIACGVDASPLIDYQGGVLDIPDGERAVDHIISVVGWGKETDHKYWIVRNSWGEFWGELGFFRIRMGDNQLGIEGDCSYAKPATWTTHNFPCASSGSNCQPH